MSAQHDEACEALCRCGQLMPAAHPDACPHESFTSRYIGRGVYQHECLDCGEFAEVSASEWSD